MNTRSRLHSIIFKPLWLKPWIFCVMLLAVPIAGHAHMPLVACFDNGDNTITCQGGFSDGSSAAGTTMRIKTPDGRVLLDGRMSDDSEFTFEKPRGDFEVLFDAGPDHRVRVPGRQIVE
jgi:hypothetical protein